MKITAIAILSAAMMIVGAATVGGYLATVATVADNSASDAKLRPTAPNCVAAFDKAEEVKYQKAKWDLGKMMLAKASTMSEEERLAYEKRYKPALERAKRSDTSVILDECYEQVVGGEGFF